MSVYTQVSHTDLQTFLTQYDLGELTHFQGISAGIENTNYFVDTTEGRFVLTIFEQHTLDELPYFLNIMAFMAEHAIPTAHPMADREGRYLKTLKDKPAALVERLQGSDLDTPSVRQCEVMGQWLAKFHLAGQDFDDFRANDRDLNWAQTTFARLTDQLPEAERRLIADEIAFQGETDWSHLPGSVIHADLFCDNALFQGDELAGIIDLYYACNGPMLYDLAVMVNDWCRLDDHTLDADKVAATLAAYQTVRSLTDAEKTAWAAAQRMGALRFYLSRLQDQYQPREGEMTQIKDPQVFGELLQSLRA
ncbi:homoserine kinase [Thiomicrospira sp. WB1]|uniref:homoserine kinase n=1 Tax=Thiomicrospira sp. WB1 TaxID=1685380 RepID=UPI0007490BE6|nr:homoserine kinase [Thiomicrospira sp. WB1]KUJ72299.1 homoserine kinase [Thiomicrospira sp. WB1]